MYISFDDGQSWQAFQLNLPIVPITDLAIKDHNLIAATQGRSFWLIDDLTVLHQLSDEVAEADAYLFKPMNSHRLDGGQGRPSRTAGQNHPGGVTVHFYLQELPADSVAVKLSFHEADGTEIRAFSSRAEEKDDKLEIEAGGNTFNWDFRYPDGVDFDGMIMWWAGVGGPEAVPGQYEVRLQIGDEDAQTESFTIEADPRSEATMEDLQAQFDFMIDVQSKVSEAHQAIIDLRDIKKQVKSFVDRLPEDERFNDVRAQADALTEGLSAVEENLYQTKNRSRQDPLNFPIKLTNKLAHLNSLVGVGDFRPTAQSYAVKEELEKLIDEELGTYQQMMREALPKLNKLIRESQVDLIVPPVVDP
jgi:hypothetical protein